MGKCPTCGGTMQPLFTGEFCPRDCDKKKDDDSWFDLTFDTKYEDDDGGASGFAAMGSLVLVCPRCGSTDTEDFPGCSAGDWHCCKCGDVWWLNGKGP